MHDQERVKELASLPRKDFSLDTAHAIKEGICTHDEACQRQPSDSNQIKEE